MADAKKGSGLHPKIDLPEGTPLGSTASPDAETRSLCPVCRQGMIPASIASFVAAALRSAGGVARSDESAPSLPPPLDEAPPSKR